MRTNRRIKRTEDWTEWFKLKWIEWIEWIEWIDRIDWIDWINWNMDWIRLDQIGMMDQIGIWIGLASDGLDQILMD